VIVFCVVSATIHYESAVMGERLIAKLESKSKKNNGRRLLLESVDQPSFCFVKRRKLDYSCNTLKL
jgi:hypothetical protein